MALVCTHVQAGFMIWFAVPFCAAIIIRAMVLVMDHSPRRRGALLQIGLVAATAAGVAGIQSHYFAAARADADEVVRHVREYQQFHGHYPATLEEAATSAMPNGRQWNIKYSPDTHAVLYFGTWRVYEYCLLQLDGGDWHCGGD
jgi:hypothetical protein